jgi:hypothetical protein
MKGWMGSRTGLDIMEKRKISSSYQELNPDSSAVQLTVYLLY